MREVRGMPSASPLGHRASSGEDRFWSGLVRTCAEAQSRWQMVGKLETGSSYSQLQWGMEAGGSKEQRMVIGIWTEPSLPPELPGTWRAVSTRSSLQMCQPEVPALPPTACHQCHHCVPQRGLVHAAADGVQCPAHHPSRPAEGDHSGG